MTSQDQAQDLRNLVKNEPKQTGDTKVISITSGKGGVGKSTVSANLAYKLSDSGFKVAILDADIGLANLDVMFNVKINKNILHLLKGQATFKEIAIDISENLTLIPGESGEEIFNYSDEFDFDKFFEEISILKNLDFLIIDTGAGIGDNIQRFLDAADEIIVVTVPDPAAITDAYATIKIIAKNRDNINLIINQVNSQKEAEGIFSKINKVATTNISNDLKLNLIGKLNKSSDVAKSIKKRTIFSQEMPNSAATIDIENIINTILSKLERKMLVDSQKKGMSNFFRNLLSKF
jgi:flagellar biosynthesis protein FlhG